MGLILWLGSISAVLMLRSSVSQMAGPLGPTVSGLIKIGYGVYVGMLGSIILVFSHFAAFYEGKVHSRLAKSDSVDSSVLYGYHL